MSQQQPAKMTTKAIINELEDHAMRVSLLYEELRIRMGAMQLSLPFTNEPREVASTLSKKRRAS